MIITDGSYDHVEGFNVTETTETFVVPSLLPGSTGWDATVVALGGAGSAPGGASIKEQSYRDYVWGSGDVGRTFSLRVGDDGKDPAHGSLGGWPNGGMGGTSVQQGNGHGGGGMTVWLDPDHEKGDLVAAGSGGASGEMDTGSGDPYSLAPYDILPPRDWFIYAYGYANGGGGSSDAFGPASGGPGGNTSTATRNPSMDAGNWYYTLSYPGPFNPRLWFSLPGSGWGSYWPQLPANTQPTAGFTEGTLWSTGSGPGEYPYAVPGGDGLSYADGGNGGGGANGVASPGGGGGGGGLGGGGGGGASSATHIADVFSNTEHRTGIYSDGFINLAGGNQVWGFVQWWGPGGSGGIGEVGEPRLGGPWGSGLSYLDQLPGSGGRVFVWMTALYGGETPNAGWKVGAA